MKNAFLICALALANAAAAQPFPVDTILWNGDAEQRINLVFLGDGYQESELPDYLEDVQHFTDALFAQTPFAEYEDYFNIVAISVASEESGASHPGTATDVSEPLHPVSDVDNYFGSTFDAFGIHRLLVAQNSSAIFTALATSFPQYDQAIIIVNSPFYGGSGGTLAVSSVNVAADEIAIHELGHSFSDLRDEYWAGDNFAMESENMTQETNPEAVRWTNWMDENGIGIYQHCCGGQSSGWHRPHQDCKMRYLGSDFCSVCTQTIVEVIHEFVSPIDGYSPTEPETVVEDEMTFALDLLAPSPNTLHTVWTLNGDVIDEDVPSVLLSADDLGAGINFLQASVEDTSAYIRIDDHSENHFYTVVWTIDQTSLSIEGVAQGSLGLRMFPNPGSEFLNVEISETESAYFEAGIFDVQGRLLKQYGRQSTAGTTTLDLSGMPAGVLIVKLELEGGVTVVKRVVKAD
jgi:hypothetical protein